VAPIQRAAARVELQGVSGALRDNVRAFLHLSDEPCDAPDWRIRRLFDQSDTEIREALEVFGHYAVAIQRSLISEEDCWVATFEIDPGTPVTLRTVEARVQGPGAEDEAFRRLVDANPLVTGLTLNHVDYDAFKKRFTGLASRRGYFDGRFIESRVDVYPAELAADIMLIYDTGERYRFGPLSIEQKVVRPNLVESFIDFEPGQPYDAGKISGLYEALLLTNYFDEIDVRTEARPAPDLDVPIVVRLTAAKPQTYTAGIGFGTDTGPKVRAGYINRRLNNKGHQFELNASVSPVISEAGASYRLPLRDPRAEWLNFDTGYKYEDTDTLESRQAKFGIKRIKRRWTDWLETQFIDLSYEDYEIGGEDGTSFLLIPGISWTQVRSSGPPRPVRGHRLNLQFSGTAEALGSDAEFLQVDLFGKFIRPLWAGARLIARGEAGMTWKEQFRDLPASVRYFAGGDFSVRGYDYKTLGPTDDTGAVIGGSHLLVGSLELDQRVAEKWSVAAFVDTGNAFQDFDDLGLKTSVGAGVRWYSPLGPIRLDLGFPLDSDAPDSVRIHITLGPDL
jgi:translocation and assembly module TamA